MSSEEPLRCRLLGHKWRKLEKNPDLETDDGFAASCGRCDRHIWETDEAREVLES